MKSRLETRYRITAPGSTEALVSYVKAEAWITACWIVSLQVVIARKTLVTELATDVRLSQTTMLTSVSHQAHHKQAQEVYLHY